ncbi:MAG: hypothetical protein AAB759_01595 [Patescibacteria group bacterium]
MTKSALALAQEPERATEDTDSQNAPRPFAVRFAERAELRLVPKPGSSEVFDDPTTVDWTSQQSPEDPHTDQ